MLNVPYSRIRTYTQTPFYVEQTWEKNWQNAVAAILFVVCQTDTEIKQFKLSNGRIQGVSVSIVQVIV